MDKRLKQALALMLIISFAASPVLNNDVDQDNKATKAGFFGDLGDFLGGVREEAGNMFGEAINNSNPQGNPQFNGPLIEMYQEIEIGSTELIQPGTLQKNGI